MLYIAFPIKIRFRISESRHTVQVANLYKGGEVLSIEHQVKAVVSDTWDGAVNGMCDAVRNEYVANITNKYPCVESRDFDVIYSIGKVEDGRVWSPGGVTQTKGL